MVKEPKVGVLAQEGRHGGNVKTKHQAGNTRNTGDEVNVGDFGAPVKEVPERHRWFDHAVFVRRETHGERKWIQRQKLGEKVRIYSGSPPGNNGQVSGSQDPDAAEASHPGLAAGVRGPN